MKIISSSKATKASIVAKAFFRFRPAIAWSVDVFHVARKENTNKAKRSLTCDVSFLPRFVAQEDTIAILGPNSFNACLGRLLGRADQQS